LRSELFDWVDLDEKFKGAAARSGLPEDKELLTTLVEGDQQVSRSLAEDSLTPSVKTAPAAVKKAARPEVTWLRRTEYISSLRPAASAAAAGAAGATQDEAKAALSESVEFSQILLAVQKTFTDCAEAPFEHPFKAAVTLEQSFLVSFDEAPGLAHCLFLGEAGKRLQERSLLQARDLRDGSGTVATLLLPKAEDDLSAYTSTDDHLEFDIQRTTEESGKRSFVLMLPVDGKHALLSPINATFALRKRRRATAVAGRQGRSKSAKQRLQVSRQ
jgi:hypothetical protein